MTESDKKILRRFALTERAALTPAELTASDRLLTAKLEYWLLERRPQLILGFLGYRNEPDLTSLFIPTRPHTWKVALPVVSRDGTTMKFHLWAPGVKLLKNRFGIDEPDPASCPEATVASGTIVLVPALLLDREGHRLGYGGGYYDRFLAEENGFVTVGIAHERFICDQVPHEGHDRRVRWLATEFGVRARS